AFCLMENKQFCAILKYQRLSTKESDMPKRTKLKEEIMFAAAVVEKRLAQHFKVHLGLLAMVLSF
ncbi:hypothetical protein C0991_009621, partial [Blastosporella zonata]